MTPEISIRECLKTAWEEFSKNAGPAIGIVVIYAILSGIGGSIPFLNAAYNLIIAPIISAGLSIFALNLARGVEGKVDDLFQGFNKFGNFLGAYWLFVLIVVVLYIPTGIGLVIDLFVIRNIPNNISAISISKELFATIPVITIVLGTASTVLLILALIRFSLVTYLIIDGMNVMDAYRESWRLTEGRGLTIVILAIINFLIGLIGFLLLFVGLLVAIPITKIAFASLYVRIKGSNQSCRHSSL